MAASAHVAAISAGELKMKAAEISAVSARGNRRKRERK
jgi:hypothetical protein